MISKIKQNNLYQLSNEELVYLYYKAKLRDIDILEKDTHKELYKRGLRKSPGGAFGPISWRVRGLRIKSKETNKAKNILKQYFSDKRKLMKFSN